MNERSYTFDDKTEWGDGPWQHEPDKTVWVDDATGLDCMIVRNRVGSLCGYVGVPEGHPWHGKDYDSLDVDVHGGLTFAAPCHADKAEQEQAICHTVLPDRPDNVWWLGFDTAHCWDLAPAVAAHERKWVAEGKFPALPRSDDVYRDLAYVQAEVAALAEQAQAVA